MIFAGALLLLAAGLGTLFFPNIRRILIGFQGYVKVMLLTYLPLLMKKAQRKTLKSRVQLLDTGARDNFIAKSYKTMSAILSRTGEGSRIRQMKIVSAVCGAVGVTISLYLKSFMLVPILGVGFALLPMWLVKFKAYRYNIAIMTELSVVLSMITNSYIRSENIVKAIEENLGYMNEPVRSNFEWFVNTCKRVSADISGNLAELKSRMDNRIFHLWCDSLVMCQRDINQKVSLNAIVEQFTTDRELINLLSTEVSAPIRVFVMVTIGTMLAFPLTALIGPQLQAGDMLALLFTSMTGQCIVIGYAVTILFGINRAIDLSTEI